MALNDQERELRLKFGGEPTSGHLVPAAVLTQTLQAFQRAIHILGMRHEGKDVRQRLRISTDVEARYAVLCQVPAAGSYICPVVIGDETQDLFAGEAVSAVTSQLYEVMTSIADQSEGRIRTLLPDPVFRTPFLEALAKMAPPKKSGVVVELQTSSGATLFAPQTAADFLSRVTERAVSDATVTTITGRLAGIEFDSRMLRLHYPPTKRELRCYYHESVEEMLLGNPRELIQVIGHVTLNDAGEPEKITEVDRILEVDLSPIDVKSFQSGGSRIVAIRPVSFMPTLDDTEQYHCIDDDVFGVCLMASTREEIESDLFDELDMLWRQYASERSENMTDGANELKRKLLSSFEAAK